MAIQRAAPMPVPPEETARLRASLAKDYGAEVWEGPERRVLVIRVPRADPDPVNDVEAAVEHLQPADVEDLTHCLLMGDERVAQVYVRPLQDLMRERLAFDRQQADHWRQELPGQLSHMLFQAAADPRRRWRLAIRLPCASVADVEEEHFDDLVEGIGPLLDTPRFKQIIAVYFVAAQDHLRLQASVFLKEMREKWVSEERQRRQQDDARKAEAETRSRAEAEKRRAEEERIALLREVDRKMARYQAEKAVGAAIPDVRHRDQATGSPAGRAPTPAATPREPGLLAEAESTFTTERPAAPARPPAPLHTADALLARAAADSADERPVPRRDAGQALGTGRDAPEGLADVLGVPAGITDRLDALRARVDNAIGMAPARAAAGRPVETSRRTPTRRAEGAPRRLATPGVPPRADARDAALPRGDTKGRLQARLEASGFDVIASPPTAGHSLDFAAERPDGDPQRVVARVVPRLDVPTAKQLLKTARELDVDLVLCVAEHVDEEAARILVATKVKLAKPSDVTAYRF